MWIDEVECVTIQPSCCLCRPQHLCPPLPTFGILPHPTERPPTTAATLFELLASTMASAAPMSPPQQLPIPPTPAIDLASASLNPSFPRVRSAGNLGASPPDTRRTGKPPRPRSSNNLLALADAMAPPRVLASPVAPNRQAAIRDLFNTLVKLIEAHLPAAQQHKLHELKQTIAKLKAKKDRAGLHAPLDAFFALVHKWAPREQWVELQKTANQVVLSGVYVEGYGKLSVLCTYMCVTHNIRRVSGCSWMPMEMCKYGKGQGRRGMRMPVNLLLLQSHHS